MHAYRVVIILAISTPLWVGPLSWSLAYHPSPVLSFAGWMILSVELLFVALAIPAVAVLIVAPWFCYQSERRRAVLVIWGAAAAFLLSLFGGLSWGRSIWRNQVERVVAGSEPLLQAVHGYARENGRPPDALEQLVPQYLPAIPSTGIGAFPSFQYVVGEPEHYDGNPWALRITPPCHFNGFDRLMYFPRCNYPAQGYGGSIERIGDWGYVHE